MEIIMILFVAACFYKYTQKKISNLNQDNLEKIFTETDYYVEKTREKTGKDMVVPYFYLVNKKTSSGVIVKYDYFKENFSFLYDLFNKQNLLVKRLTHKGITNRYVLDFLSEEIVVYPYISVEDTTREYKHLMDNVFPSIYFLETYDLNKIFRELELTDVCEQIAA
jgi:hypothetical protein